MREIQASGGFISFDAPVAYFGLGQFTRVDRVEVEWSTGERTEIRGDFPAGARYVLRRPRRRPRADGGTLRQLSRPDDPAHVGNESRQSHERGRFGRGTEG